MPIPQKIKMYYDPLGRVVKTVNPNNSQQWAITGIPSDILVPSDPVSLNASYIPTPWVNFTYDSNDLAPITNPTGSNVPSDHYYTPKSAEVDALGRTIKTTEHIDKVNNPPVDNIEMNYNYDVRGNLLLVKDPYDRNVFEHVYDLRPGSKDKPAPPIKTVHIDKGLSTILFDALEKPIESFDAKGAQDLSAYDVLQRPTYIWAHDNTGETTTLRQFLFYGDSLGGTPEDDNLKGKLYQHYDEAGLVEIPEYDFKGNVLEKTRQVISDSEILSVFGGPTVDCYRVDWYGVPSSPPAILDATIYETSLEYDALNRIVTMTYPEDLDGLPRKILTPTYNTAGALEKIDLDGTEYVSNIAYNAKGQRLLVAFGNGIMTRYAYDNFTFRLLRQRSESFTETDWVYMGTGNVKQDTAYQYDLVGNIVATSDTTTGCGIGGTDSLDRDFDYDAIYRLLSANGRENSPTITPIWDDSYRSTDDSTTTTYTQNYDYDKLGNIQTLQHTGNSSFTRTFNYTSTSNKLDSVDIGMTNYAFTYDDCGNQLTETSSRHWEWDSKDMPRCFYVEATGSITQYTQYLYGADGKRVKKLTWKTGGIYDSISYLDGIFEYRTDGTDEQNILHVMDDSSRIATVRIGDDFGDTTPATKYNLEDLLGSSIMQLEYDGTDINREEYYPFGETSFGSYEFKRYKYCAKERDEESGLYYYGARYYSAWICRFVSVDPLANRYSNLTSYQYAGNRPVNFSDIDGLESPANAQTPSAVNTKEGIEKILKALDQDLSKTLLDSQASEKRARQPEFGGIIIRDKISQNIKSANPTGGGANYYSDFSNIDKNKYEVAGEYHDHPYSEGEIKARKKDLGSSFNGLGVTFDTSDLINLGKGDSKSELKKDYVSIIEAGDTRYVLVITDVEKFKKFTSGMQGQEGASIIDEAMKNAFEGKDAKFRNGGNFGQANWEVLNEALKNYTDSEGNKIDVGFDLYRTTDKGKTTVEKAN